MLHMEQASSAQRIAENIRGSGVTLVWLGEKTGIPRVTLSRRMANPESFSVNELERIATALRTTPDALMSGLVA